MGKVIELNPQPVPEERDFVTAPEIVHQAKISYRQLDYWTRTGLLASHNDDPGRGNHRHYPREQLARAKAISALLDAGLDLAKLRERLADTAIHGAVTITHGPVTITYTPKEDPA